MIRKLNKKVQFMGLNMCAAVCQYLGKAYDNRELTRVGDAFRDREVREAYAKYCDEGAFFPMSVLPKGYKKNKKLVENLMNEFNRC